MLLNRIEIDTGQTVRKPWSKPALAAPILGLAAILAVAASGIGYRLGWWHFTVGLEITRWAAYGAVFVIALSATGLIQARPGGARRGLASAALGLLLALPPVAMALHWEYTTRTYPPINDISTDTEDPPVFWDMPTPTDYLGGDKADMQRAAYPDLAPLVLPLPPDQAFAAALALVERRGWEIVVKVPEEGRIEATASSFLYGFKDEVIIRVTAADAASRIDMRSRSRIGLIDRGVNARRIREFLGDLNQERSAAGVGWGLPKRVTGPHGPWPQSSRLL